MQGLIEDLLALPPLSGASPSPVDLSGSVARGCLGPGGEDEQEGGRVKVGQLPMSRPTAPRCQSFQNPISTP